MTSIPLTCDGFAEALADYLERDDTPRIRAAVEAHAASCAECGALLSDLQQLRVDAGGLPTLTPSRDLWERIAARIEAPVIEIGQRTAGGGLRAMALGRARTWLRPMAAAAALVVITAGVTYFATREALLSGTQIAAVDSALLNPHRIVADANDSARQVASRGQELETRSPSLEPRTSSVEPRPAVRGTETSSRGPRTADPGPRTSNSAARAVAVANQPSALTATLETVYGREISRLRRIVDERRTLLDTATVGVIERNLTIIDRAIQESRAALARDPASAFLNEQLNNALEQKVELLRAAALLPVRT